MLNVLSLFDGISGCQVALNSLGIAPDIYYSSEIDRTAIGVTQRNFPKTVQMGDVRDVSGKDYGDIDLIAAGSPCQGFSRNTGGRLNFKHPKSRLFFEFLRILQEASPRYFFLENVVMKQEFQDVISGYLGVEPLRVNSALLTAQNRDRLYWSNIPKMTVPEDSGILLTDITYDDASVGCSYRGRRDKESNKYVPRLELRSDGKANCLTLKNQASMVVDYPSGEPRHFSQWEREALQGFPQGYTDGLSLNQQKNVLGNSWTVPVIAHLMRGLK